MENNNQRIIFSVSDDTTPSQIILEILRNNGFNNPTDDMGDKSKLPRAVLVMNVTKDFFEKKMTEGKLYELLQKDLPASKENAMGIINGIKEKLIPYAKKITIPNENGKDKLVELINTIKPPIGVGEILKSGAPIPEEGLGSRVIDFKKIKRPAISEDINMPSQKPTMPSGPDNYREPIE